MGRARSSHVALGAILIAGATLTAGAARAQAPADTSRMLHVSASALRPGTFVYDMTLERDVSTTVVGTRTVSVSQASYANAPAWLLLETRTGTGIDAVDSLFADTSSLQPLHWSATLGQARLAVEFRGDTAFGATSAPQGTRSMIAPVPAGTLVSGAMLETELRLLPLQSVWEDSATTLSVTLSGTTLLPTRLAVIGEDRVRVPAGTFDCWVVSVHAGDAARGLYWVTKSDPIVVRSTVDVPLLGGAQLVNALTRIAR